MTIRRRLVVTIDRAGARLAQFVSQPGAQGFEVFDGVDLTDPQRAAEVEMDREMLLFRYGRTLAPGEIGCALSHQGVMRAIAADPALEEDDLVLVVEDDAVLHPDLEQVLSWIATLRFDLMALHHGSASRLGLLEPEGSELMERLYPLSPLAVTHAPTGFRAGFTTPESWMGTVGYVVRKGAAARLSGLEVGPLGRVADDYRVIVDHGLRVCQIRPSLVWESPEFDSVITQSGRTLGSTDTSDQDVARRMREQASSRSLRVRKSVWVLTRDLTSRIPSRVRHHKASDALRVRWNVQFQRLAPRVRHLLRPGLP